jgi:GT2 family glycosyltransferase
MTSDIAPEKLISIIILNWNSMGFLEPCLASIQKVLHWPDTELIIVDNGSRDGSLEWLEANYPQANVIRNPVNRGVAPARNQALRIARGRYLLLLDVDTLVKPGALETLLKYMDAHPWVGICAPKLVSPEGRLQYSCRKFPTIWSKVLRRLPLAWASRQLDEEELKTWDHNGVAEVEYVIGACQLVRRRALEEVGLLDEVIFYGPEDVDFCLRAWKRGWKVVYNGDAMIVHHELRVTRRVFSRLTLHHLRGLVYFFIKHRYFFSAARLRFEIWSVGVALGR